MGEGWRERRPFAGDTLPAYIDALDTLIAAHALALEVTLVTNNAADFRGFDGLVVENWVAEG
jgi:predicted nucleic acid-binding protein